MRLSQLPPPNILLLQNRHKQKYCMKQFIVWDPSSWCPNHSKNKTKNEIQLWQCKGMVLDLSNFCAYLKDKGLSLGSRSAYMKGVRHFFNCFVCATKPTPVQALAIIVKTQNLLPSTFNHPILNPNWSWCESIISSMHHLANWWASFCSFIFSNLTRKWFGHCCFEFNIVWN